MRILPKFTNLWYFKVNNLDETFDFAAMRSFLMKNKTTYFYFQYMDNIFGEDLPEEYEKMLNDFMDECKSMPEIEIPKISYYKEDRIIYLN